MFTPYHLLRISLAFSLLLCGVGLASGQLPSPVSQAQPSGDKTKQVIYPFDATDRIHGAVGRMKNHYFVGEPIVVPVMLANHTRFPITLETSFNPRSNLKVMIRPEGEAQFRYNGPYMKGIYSPTSIFMYPYDQIFNNVVIWADVEQPGHLAIGKPGTYTIDVSLLLKVVESTLPDLELKLDGGTFTITVDPTPKEYEPLIELFKQRDNLVYLQLHKNPPVWGPKTSNILSQYPRTVFTPWLCYSLGTYYVGQYEEKPTSESADNALKYMILASHSDSPFREELYLSSLLPFMDKLDLSRPAALTAAEFLTKLPSDLYGRIGNDSLLQKYLVNTEELNPIKYWAFLP